jgi:hypothetical protein
MPQASGRHGSRENERREADRALHHLAHERRREYGDTAVVYPWWLYNNGDYGNPYYDGNYYNNNPPVVNSAPAESAPAYTPGPDYNAARSTMAAVQARELAALQASPQWVSATTDLQKAMADVDAATTQLQASLLARPDYRAAVDQKQAAQDRAAALHEQGGASDADIFAAAEEDLSASTTISHIERASANDSTLVEARTRLQAASLARQALYNQLKSRVMSDPQWQAAKQQLAAAE